MNGTVIRPDFGHARKPESETEESEGLNKSGRAHVEKVRAALGSLITIIQQHQLQIGCVRTGCAMPEYSQLVSASETYKDFCSEVEATFDQIESPLKRTHNTLDRLLEGIKDIL